MIVYAGTKTEFLTNVDNDSIAIEIEKNIYEKMHRATGYSEFRSWENSLEYMYKVLNDSEIPNDAGVAIEYNVPQTSKRVDFLISGFDRDNKGNVIIIELKQWDKLKSVSGKDGLVETFTGGANRQVVHPSYQAWSYAKLIEDYNASVEDYVIMLHPCAYLHNYRRKENDPLDDPQYEEYLNVSPAYTRGQVYELRNFIKKCIVTGDNKDLIYKIDNGRIRPSKSLQDSISGMLKGNQEFVMLDEQKVVYETILNLSRKCQKDQKKRVVIIEGGPGTGKSVVAINLLSQLTNEGQFVQYVSKNSAPRNVFRTKLKGTKRMNSIDNMFKGSGTYVDTVKNSVDTLLIDEAHRLNEKSGMFKNLGENQIKEIINASLCSVFFIDESQRVDIYDIGTKEEIKKWALKAGVDKVYTSKLVSQFRCNGSDGYLAWIDNTLEICKTANESIEELNYDFKVINSPEELKNIIFEKNKLNNRARLLAGYCWNWDSNGKSDTSVHDIKIDDFEMSWNLGNTQTWAIDPNSVNEVGCIHTSQGLEFDYVGVIIGNDLRYENGQIVTDFTKRAKTDNSLKGIKTIYKQDSDKALKIADIIIKNTYRTLMTRGMKGCYVYCVDKGLSDYLISKL